MNLKKTIYLENNMVSFFCEGFGRPEYADT